VTAILLVFFGLPVGTSGDELHHRHYPLVTVAVGCNSCDFIEDATERIDIGASIARLTFLLLGWHVCGRAHHHAASGQRVVSRDFASPKSRTFMLDFAIMMLPGLRSR
jgi:hypothetical protein